MFVGIDVSKAQLDVAVLPSAEVFAVPNTPEGITALLERFGRDRPELIVLEPSGGYETLVYTRLASAGLRVALIQPKRILEFIRATGKKAKNDRLDALHMAQFAQTLRPEPRALPDQERRELEFWVSRREQLQAMLVSEKHRLGLSDAVVRDSIVAHIDFLERQLKDADQELHRRVQTSSTLSELADLLQSVPGVGPVTACTLLARLPELGRVSREEIAALVGLAPYDRDSGQHRGKRCIQGGRADVRKVLYMAAQSARRYNPPVQALFARLEQAHKGFKRALTACMRKLLVQLNAIVASGKPFDPDHLTPTPAHPS